MLKKLLLLSFFGFSFATNCFSQNSCDKKIATATKYLITHESVSEEIIIEMEKSLEECMDNTLESIFLTGLIELNRKPIPNYTLAYQDFEAAALEGHAKAKTHLGFFYKYGWDRPIEFDQAFDWFEEAADLGDPVAQYSLGYFYLKGLGSVEQDYLLAGDYFSQSTDPMAKHWEAVCKYFGFGVVEDKNSALIELETNNIINSEVLSSYFTSSENILINSLEDYNTSQNLQAISNINEVLNDSLHGKLVEKDWSGTKIMRTVPITVIIERLNSQFLVTVNIDELTYQGLGNLNGNTLTFNNLVLELPILLKDDENQTNLEYKIERIVIQKNQDNDEYVCEIKTWLPKYSEPGQPITANLVNQRTLNSRIQNSIVISPNHFRGQCSIAYNLEKKSTVNLKLYDFNGNPVKNFQLSREEMIIGSHNFSFDGNNLPQATYILELNVDGHPFTNQIIKIN